MMTVYDLMKRSLRMIGQLGPGRGPNESEQEDALLVLNNMLDQSNTRPLMRFATSINAYPLAGDKWSYTLGPGGDWDADRPVRIDRANYILTSLPTVRTPIKILDEDGWAEISVQQVPGSQVPLKIYPDGAYPLINVHVWPGGSALYQIELYTWKQIQQFCSVDDLIEAPPGYVDWMSYNLAERLGPEWSKPVPPMVTELARRSRAYIEGLNAWTPKLKSDAPTSEGAFNYRTGKHF